VIDALIAASAVAIGATVVTGDEATVRAAGAEAFNPWDARPDHQPPEHARCCRRSVIHRAV